MASGGPEKSNDQNLGEQPSLEDLLPKFYRQANSFQQFGKDLETYVKGVRGMKTAMMGVHKTVLSVCGKDWPSHEEFHRVLEDQAELWTMLENDIHKMGNGFQHYASEFYLVFQSINCRKQKLAELTEMKKSAEKMKKSSRGKSAEKAALMKIIQEKCRDLDNTDARLVDRIIEIQDGQRKFIAEQYGQFLAAQAEFCKDNLAVLNLVPDILTNFLPKLKPRQKDKKLKISEC